MAAPEKPSSSSKGQAWFCTTGLPSDIVIEVDDMTFHLHKVFFIFFHQSLNSFLLFYAILHSLILVVVCDISVSFDVQEPKASRAYNGARN